MDDLAPVGALEEELAERVAVLSWRLRRVTSYEAGMVSRNSDRAASRVSGELEAVAVDVTVVGADDPHTPAVECDRREGNSQMRAIG